ncbi:MAG: hypothetical protein IPN19_02095 [Elusimicrobia bacterium]|nr:hypothetical protein [Elusimicrobiota bacterium]
MKDLYSYSPVMGAMREEAQTTVSLTVNTYKVILGQAQVVKSVTTSDALNKDGRKIRSTEHGYNHSVTTVRYQFNAKGQLTGATGRTVGTSTAMVKTYKGVVDAAGNAVMEQVDVDGNGSVGSEDSIGDVNGDDEVNAADARAANVDRNGDRRVTEADLYTYRTEIGDEADGGGAEDEFGDGEHVCDHIGPSAGGEERDDVGRVERQWEQVWRDGARV